LRVTGIFTGTTSSPSNSLRQSYDRYSLRAGRSLPDKEFRYLRTVIVTAAVHRGFASSLRSRVRLTFRHWAGVSPYTSACALAETCVFGKQSLEPFHCGPLGPPDKQDNLLGHPFFRRYGVNLPSSLTEGHSFTWGAVPLPTGVGMRYGRYRLWLAAFLGGLGTGNFRPVARTRARTHGSCRGDLPPRPTRDEQPTLSIRWAPLPYRVPASLSGETLRCRTIQPACHRLRLQRPRLRTRLTLGRLTVPRNPQAFGGGGSHTTCATHSGIRTSVDSTSPCGLASWFTERSPTIPSASSREDSRLRSDA